MDREEIINYLNDNGIEHIDSIQYDEEVVCLKLYYYFNEEGEDKPYSIDKARESMEEIIQDIKEEFNLEAQYMCYDDKICEEGFVEFIIAFYEKGIILDLDHIISSVM
ncbi:hypothetical protein FDF74_01760 [Clostridium niameyense]|uniref:Uncharacterized protein n=1 Tax=Clostridium niameyense TaxID=1622073 RepID=A0A6M0R6Y6_9CLOT|nr:hypothetical protein [Clostridium niameyense]NEZ45934.1 hypothetical protein [Clostridium niameyense]